MRKSVILFSVLFLAGCSRADIEVLGRIGVRVEKKAEVIWKAEPNSKLLKSLPLLQQPEGGVAPEVNDGGAVSPRLNVK